VLTMADDTRIMLESHDWEHTSRGDGKKVKCPVCGSTGYPGGKWTLKHNEHADCDICGKTVSKRGLVNHKARAHPGWRADEQFNNLPRNDIEELMVTVEHALDDARAYGVEVEVMVWALMFARKHPEIDLPTIVDWGCDEWLK